MNWSLQIPYRERSDPLTEVVDAARELPTDEERAVVRQLVLDEIVGGTATTAGELLDKIEKAAPAERRKMLDDARAGAGLPTTGKVEFEAQHKFVQHAARLKAGNDHRPMRLAYNQTGGIVDLNERDDDIARAGQGGIAAPYPGGQGRRARCRGRGHPPARRGPRGAGPPRDPRPDVPGRMTPAEAHAKALNVVMRRRLCEHEAGHCAAALIGGLDVREAWAGDHDVTVEPSDPDQAAGHVLMAVDRDDLGEVREHAIAVLAGPMCEGAAYWPPRWPLLVPMTSDERQLAQDVEALGLDKKGYSELVHDAYDRVTTPCSNAATGSTPRH